MQPKVQIDVDEVTGVWTTDGFPMVYVPRHFMVGMHRAQEEAFGRDWLKAVLDKAGAESAYVWCERSAQQLNLNGVETFAHYLERLTVRGWGIFKIAHLDEAAGTATITIKNSIYVLEEPKNTEKPSCYMFEGFFQGGFQYLLDGISGASRRALCKEVECETMGAPQCTFNIIAV